MPAIPTINIASLMERKEPGDQVKAGQIARACHEFGFLGVTGHGIPASLITQLRGLLVEFFDQPLDAKQRLKISQDNYRGYIPLKFFTPNASGKEADGYEGYKLHAEVDSSDPIRDECSLYGPNKWPDFPAGLRPALQSYWQHCDRITQVVLSALLTRLDVHTGFLREAFEYPLTNMTLLHYPVQESNGSGVGIHAHKDTDVLTLLAPDAVGGLQIRTRSSKGWLEVDTPADGLIINIGDMLELWSGGYYVSTPHRVISTTGVDRYSFPYFAVPRHDLEIKPLCQPQAGFTAAPMVAGNVSRKIWQSNWPGSSPIETCYDPAIN